MKKAFEVLCYYLGRYNRWYMMRYYGFDEKPMMLGMVNFAFSMMLYTNLATPFYIIIGPKKVSYFDVGMLISFFTLYPLLRRYIARNQDRIMATYDAMGYHRPWYWPVLVVGYVVATWLSLFYLEDLRQWVLGWVDLALSQ